MNGTNIVGATNAALGFLSAALTNAGTYSVMVSNPGGSVTSSNAVLAVRSPGAPFIRVDGQLVVSSVSNVAVAMVTIESGYSNGVVFYTLDGSTPDFVSPIYSSPVVLTSNAVVRAMGLNVDTFDTAEAPAVSVSILFPVTATTAGGGNVNVNPNQALHLSGSIPSVSATPSAGWTFLHWQGDATGTANPLNLPVTGPKNVSAVFGTTLQTGAIGSGAIELSATNLIPYGTLVRATAIPNSGSYFAQWGSALTGTNSPAWFSVVSTNPVRAVFGTLQAGQAALSVRIVGAGNVSVNPQQQVYAVNDNVTLTATPQDEYYGFNGWSGDASSTTNPLSLTLSSSKVVTANFSLLPPTLGISQQGSSVVLNWPVVYSNYFLLDATALTVATWNTNTSAKTNLGDNITVTMPLTNDQTYFRLVQ